MQLCVVCSTLLGLANISYCLNLQSYPKSSITYGSKRSVLLRLYFCRQNYKIHLSLHVKCSIFLSDFTKMWILRTNFSKILQIQVPWISVEWESSWYTRTERRINISGKAKRRFSRLYAMEPKQFRNIWQEDVKYKRSRWDVKYSNLKPAVNKLPKAGQWQWVSWTRLQNL